jgi:uncharacterized protein (DUF1697 family)
MTKTYIALLRAINVAGHQPVAMSDLRELMVKLGFSDVRSLLQSGNLVFRSELRKAEALERLLESGAAKHLGLQTDFFVRTAEEWKQIVAANPFREEAKRDPGHLLLMLLKDAPTREQVSGLQEAVAGREVVRADGRQAYIVYPDGVGRSRLTNALIEKKLGTRSTGRNWNTVLKVLAQNG